MKKCILIAATAFAALAVQAQQAEQKDYIEVNAKASVEVSPDVIFVRVVLDENDTKGKTSVAQMERAMFDAVKKAGIDAGKNVTLADTEAGVKSYVLWKNESRSRKVYLVKTDVKHLTPLYKALDDNGIFNIDLHSTRISRIVEISDSLRVEAVKIAQARAMSMAGAIGQQIGKAIYVTNYDNTVYDAAPMMLTRAKAAGYDNAIPDTDFKTTKVQADVTARFLLP